METRTVENWAKHLAVVAGIDEAEATRRLEGVDDEEKEAGGFRAWLDFETNKAGILHPGHVQLYENIYNEIEKRFNRKLERMAILFEVALEKAKKS